MKSLNIPYMIELLQEATCRLGNLGSSYELTLAPAFATVIDTLQAPAYHRHHQGLVLSAARQRITTAEKHVIRGMIEDARITFDQMPDLLRIRIICAELLDMINDTSEEMKRR